MAAGLRAPATSNQLRQSKKTEEHGMLIDSHCHLNYLDDPDGAIERARQSGVSSCLCISVDEQGYAGGIG